MAGKSNNGGYNQGNNQYNGNNNNYDRSNRNQSQKKHSGSKTGLMKNGEGRYTTGWNKSRQNGFVTFLCVPTSKSVKSESQTGNKYISVMIKVRKHMTPEITTNGLMNLATGQVTIDSMGLVLNPKAPNGGYCGRYGKK